MSSAKTLLAAAHEAFAEGRKRDALQLCDRAALVSAAGRYDAARLRGDILLSMNDAAGALSCYESVADVSVPDPSLDCARGQALFLLGRLAEADNALRSSLSGPTPMAAAHYTLGLISEMTQTGEHIAHFRRARQLDPIAFPARARLSAEQFRAAVDLAIEGLAEPLQDLLREIPVLVAYLPSVDDLAQHGPRLSPLALAMVVGVLEPKHQPLDKVDHIDLGLLLYRRNFERLRPTDEPLTELIGRTIAEQLRDALEQEDMRAPPEVVRTPSRDDS